jgi:hypothetical protein
MIKTKENIMGRPVNKKYFGALADGTNLTVNCKVGANAATEQGMIISQRGVAKFKVDDSKLGSGNEGVCTLVAKASGSLAANEMSINGIITADGSSVWVTKIYNRTCRDENNNRYTWTVEDDSSVSYMALVAI